MARCADPFHVARQDYVDEFRRQDAIMVQLNGLRAADPQRHALAGRVHQACGGLGDELQVLGDVVEHVAARPDVRLQFAISDSELAARRAWISGARQQLAAVRQACEAAMPPPDDRRRQPPQLPPPQPGNRQADPFLAAQQQAQAELLKQQDAHLDDLGAAVQRIAVQGRRIGQELEEQAHLVDGLDADVDRTALKLKAAQKQMNGVMRRL